MSQEIVMPQMGLSMDSGEIVEWVKQTGDKVKPGDILFVVESDKAAVEVEAVAEGILHIMHSEKSGPIPVGQAVGYILAGGEQPPAAPLPNPTASSSSVEPRHQQVEAGPTGEYQAESMPKGRRLPSSPAARRLARELGVDWQQATGTGPNGRIKARDVEALAAGLMSTPATVQISPLAQRMAEAFDLDVTLLADAYPDTRIARDHVEALVRRLLKQSGTPIAAPSLPDRRQPMSGMRRTIGRRMRESWQVTAPVTLTTEAIAGELVKIRTQFKADAAAPFIPSYNALLAQLTAKALTEYPALNASIDGDEIVFHSTVNLGVAVQTDRGLVVPVISHVERRTLQEVNAVMDDLLPRAAAGKAQIDELQGSTFTLTNLGKYEIDSFTPIINLPECAILGVGRLVERVVPVGGQPRVETMMALSLTFDHRLVDGAPAAQFLQRIKQYVESPYLWMV